MRLVPFVLALVLVGCGGGSAENEAQLDWESGSGPAYAAYQDGYRRGAAEGCESASERIHDDDPEAYFGAVGGLCAYPPESAQEETPFSPPDDPETAGYELGLFDGCEYAYWQADEEQPGEFCPVE